MMSMRKKGTSRTCPTEDAVVKSKQVCCKRLAFAIFCVCLSTSQIVYGQADDIQETDNTEAVDTPSTGENPTAANPTEAVDQYGTLDDLPTDVRQQFDAAYDDYQEAKRKLSAATSEKLVQAREGVDEGRGLEDQFNLLRAEYERFQDAVDASGKDAKQKFTRWRQLLIKNVQADYYLECSQSPECREFLKPFAKAAVASHIESTQRGATQENADPGWSNIQSQLPDDPADISEEKAFEFLLEWSRTIDTQTADELEQLGNALEPPDSVKKHVTARYLANIKLGIFLPYVEQAERGGVASLKNRVSQTHQRLSSLWPSWERKLKEGPYAYLANPASQWQPASNTRRILILINLVAIALVVLFFAFRKKNPKYE